MLQFNHKVELKGDANIKMQMGNKVANSSKCHQERTIMIKMFHLYPLKRIHKDQIQMEKRLPNENKMKSHQNKQ